MLTDKELDLMVELNNINRKMKKIEKEKLYNANKISKFIYFFFTLQNKGIPVNEIYEKDGVKFIKTDRFQEIMGQNAGMESAPEEKDDSGFSFYSDDSFEYCPVDQEIYRQSKFKNKFNVIIPSLDFEDLPEYETTDDEEEEGQQQEPPEQSAHKQYLQH